MAKKHQIRISSKKGRAGAHRSWRHQAKQKLSELGKHLRLPRSKQRKAGRRQDSPAQQKPIATLGEIANL